MRADTKTCERCKCQDHNASTLCGPCRTYTSATVHGNSVCVRDVMFDKIATISRPPSEVCSHHSVLPDEPFESIRRHKGNVSIRDEEDADSKYYKSSSKASPGFDSIRLDNNSLSEGAKARGTIIRGLKIPSVARNSCQPCQPRLKKEPPDPPGPSGDPKPKPHPDLTHPWPDRVSRVFSPTQFLDRLTKRLLPFSVAGLQMAVHHEGNIFAKEVGKSRRAPDKYQDDVWELERLAIGSANKTTTAILVAIMLNKKGISPDSQIGEYLPKDTKPPFPPERSISPGKGVASLTWRELLTMRTGLVYSSSKEGYMVLQTDVTNFNPDTDWSYSNEDYHAVRYPLYHLAGNPKPTGPKVYTSEGWNTFLDDYHRKVGEFTAFMTEKYVLNPSDAAPYGWGYPDYSEADPAESQHLPLYYKDKDGQGVNPWALDNRKNAGVGSLAISATGLCRVINKMANGHLLSSQWKTVLTTVNDVGSAKNGGRSYCGGMWVSLDSVNGRYYNHGGIVGRARSMWMNFPYANVQAVAIRNSSKYISWVDLMYAYKHAWTPKIPDWILSPEVVGV